MLILPLGSVLPCIALTSFVLYDQGADGSVSGARVMGSGGPGGLFLAPYARDFFAVLLEPHVVVRQDGLTIAEIPLEMRVVKQTLTWAMGIAAFAAPIASAFSRGFICPCRSTTSKSLNSVVLSRSNSAVASEAYADSSETLNRLPSSLRRTGLSRP